MIVSMPSRNERAVFFRSASFASERPTCSPTSSTDWSPALAAHSIFSSVVPFNVHNITDDVIAAFFGGGGAGAWAFAAATAAAPSAVAWKKSRLFIAFSSLYHWTQSAGRRVLLCV